MTFYHISMTPYFFIVIILMYYDISLIIVIYSQSTPVHQLARQAGRCVFPLSLDMQSFIFDFIKLSSDASSQNSLREGVKVEKKYLQKDNSDREVFKSLVSFLLAQFINTASLVIMGHYMSKENIFLHFLQLFEAVRAVVTLVKRLPLDVVICIVSCFQFDVSDHLLLNDFQFILVNPWKS